MSWKVFSKSGHPATLFMAFFYFWTSFMVWVLLGVLGISIAKDFGLTASQKGLLTAIPILGGALIRIPLGFLVDHIGAKKTGIICQWITLVPLFGIWLWGDSFAALMIGGFFLGIAGGSFTISMPLASSWYPPQFQGTALGLVGAGTSGSALASLSMPLLAEMVGWRNVFGIAIVPMTLVLAAFAVLVKESPSRPAPKKLGDYLTVFKESDTYWFSLFYGITFGGFVGLASFLGIFYYDQYGLSKINAGLLTALCALAGSLTRPLGGHLADRFGGVRLLTVLFGWLALMMAAVATLPTLAVTAVLIFSGMVAMGMGNGAVFQLVPLRFQKQMGVMTGVVGAAGGLGGFFLPTLLGFFKQAAGSYSFGFMIFAFVSLMALVVLQTVRKSWSFHKGWLPRIPTPEIQPDFLNSVGRS